MALPWPKPSARLARAWPFTIAGAKLKRHAVVWQVQTAGGEALAVQADVTKAEEVDRMVQKVHAHFGRIDVLINTAALCVVRQMFRLGTITSTMFSVSMRALSWQ